MSNKRPKLLSYALNSPTRWLGVVCALLGTITLLLGFEVFDRAGFSSEDNESEGLSSFMLGAVLGLVAGPFFTIGFMSRLWGRVTLLSGGVKVAILSYVLASGQAAGFVEPFMLNPWFFLAVNLDGLVLFAMLITLQNRGVAVHSRPEISGARQAHADYMLRANAMNSWIAGSALADRVQSVQARKALSALMVMSVLFLTFIYLIGFHDPILIAAGVPEDAPMGDKLNSLFGFDVSWFVQALLFIPVFVMIAFQMSLRPLMALNDEPLDERQVQIIRFAHADGRMISLIILGVMIALPVLGAPHTVIGPLALCGFLLAWLTPYLIMAWNLPPGDGRYDDEEDEDFLEVDYA